MSTKTNGAEWKRYYNDISAWPYGAYHEDETITVDGVDSIDFDPDLVSDGALITLSGGVYFATERDREGRSLEAHFKAWRKRQTTTWLIVEAQNDRLDAIKAAIKAAGGRVRA